MRCLPFSASLGVASSGLPATCDLSVHHASSSLSVRSVRTETVNRACSELLVVPVVLCSVEAFRPSASMAFARSLRPACQRTMLQLNL